MRREETTTEDLQERRGLVGGRDREPGRTSLLASIAFTIALCLGATGCEQQSATDEAIEEIRDEADDAKSAIEDEIDDHT